DIEGVRASEMMRCLILLCIHTGGQRPYEIAASKWTAINWDERTLLITPDLSKNKRSHLVPLTDSAMSLLRRLRERESTSPFIFPHYKDENDHVRLDSLSQTLARYRDDHPHFEHFIPRDLRR
ncbi:tyrosine-type recombinase/integrase, partial [Vibrio parahaemolyticus]|nr:tyrosine-type recombinase/integrase [Vibrio parahaemolyticus]